MSFASLTIHVTDRCQLNCDHCLRDPGGSSTDIDVGVVCSVLDQARDYRVSHVGFTGGEPTLHPKFWELVDAAVSRGFTWHMVNNGERFDRIARKLMEHPDRVAGMSAVNFSIDGADESTHDAIRGRGSFQNLMRAMSICSAHGIEFLVQMTINARNQHQVEEFGLFGASMGATQVSYNFTQPTGTFLDASLHMTAQQWRVVRDRVLRMGEVLAVPVAYAESFPRDARFFVCNAFSSETLHINHRGELTLCCQHSGVPGAETDIIADLNEVSLQDAHIALLQHINELQIQRVQELKGGSDDPWDEFPCNWCLKCHGRPHWDDTGSVGPKAERPRWRGAWAPEARVENRPSGPGDRGRSRR